jgi:hypothetical protein
MLRKMGYINKKKKKSYSCYYHIVVLFYLSFAHFPVVFPSDIFSTVITMLILTDVEIIGQWDVKHCNVNFESQIFLQVDTNFFLINFYEKNKYQYPLQWLNAVVFSPIILKIIFFHPEILKMFITIEYYPSNPLSQVEANSKPKFLSKIIHSVLSWISFLVGVIFPVLYVGRWSYLSCTLSNYSYFQIRVVFLCILSICDMLWTFLKFQDGKK